MYSMKLLPVAHPGFLEREL